jgi:hypothetical protein
MAGLVRYDIKPLAKEAYHLSMTRKENLFYKIELMYNPFGQATKLEIQK